jgi:cytochrome oxidase Cu insertion factor (SCO1/SenC/PrrC family)
MGLQQRLDEIRQGFEKQAPPEALAVMHRVTDDLHKSGLVDRAPKEGQTAPTFELEDNNGRQVNLSSLLERGPLVLTFFRGHW